MRLKQVELSILFVYIGWAERYDGTEPIEGDFSYFKRPSAVISEASAFHPDKDGLYRCGIGRGELGGKRLNVVFVARNRKSNQLKIVGIYVDARVEMDDDWAVAVCNKAILIPSQRRTTLGHWPSGQGLRRWAWRRDTKGKEYPLLRKEFNQLLTNLSRLQVRKKKDIIETDSDFDGFEGVLKRRFVVHRSREHRLRRAKIRQVLSLNKGKLKCEVPRCGFDFSKRYGELGMGYAHVHHLKPLGSMPDKGSSSNLADLAVVCANCHAMIHKSGESRPLETLIPS
ncbi:MAG: HNH endonuclease [Fimbriimonadaceae bacterium]|nr:HNH endonuclease [Fimbriimonadaceae bacterium]